MRFLVVAGLALFASFAYAQTEPPALWTGTPRWAPVADADREHAGARAVGDTLAESADAYTRTARLLSAYDADVQGEHIALPVDTPFVARSAPIPMAVAPPGVSARREPRAAPGTVIWCAVPQSGRAPCFFWDAADGVHGHALMTGGAPSERAWLGTATPAPPPNIVEQDVDLRPNERRLVLHDVNAEGYVVRLITREGGGEYSRTYRRQAWNSWHYTWAAPSQRVRATPIVDEAGAITGANVEFTRERAQ